MFLSQLQLVTALLPIIEPYARHERHSCGNCQLRFGIAAGVLLELTRSDATFKASGAILDVLRAVRPQFPCQKTGCDLKLDGH